MLNYLLNEAAEKAGFKREKVGGVRRNIFWKHDNKSSYSINQRGADLSKPDVQLFRVFEAKLSLGDRSNGRGQPDRQLFLNVDVAHKHLAARSLREFIDELARDYEGP